MLCPWIFFSVTSLNKKDFINTIQNHPFSHTLKFAHHFLSDISIFGSFAVSLCYVYDSHLYPRHVLLTMYFAFCLSHWCLTESLFIHLSHRHFVWDICLCWRHAYLIICFSFVWAIWFIWVILIHLGHFVFIWAI